MVSLRKSPSSLLPRRGALTLALSVLGALWLAPAFAAEAAVSLPDPAADAAPAAAGTQTAVLAGGCFWGIQAVYQHTKGVERAVSGYAGGKTAKPSYEEVSSGTTGHAESVEITYNPREISYGQILKIFFSVAHDPTQKDRQGPDTGTQYRSAIYFTTPEQKQVAQAYIDQLGKTGVFKRPIVTELAPLQTFYPAEGYHQDYAVKHPYNPYIAINDAPKVVNLKRLFAAQYRDEPVLVAAASN